MPITMPANLNLHIDRLVIDGLALSSHANAQLQQVIASELAALLQTGGWSPDASTKLNVARLAGADWQLPEHHDPASLGHSIADAIYQSITVSP